MSPGRHGGTYGLGTRSFVGATQTPLASQTTELWERTLLDHADGGVILVLHQHLSNAAEEFDERRTGLDHLAFRVPDYDALLAWQEWLESFAVSCSPIADAPPRGGKVLNSRDADGVAPEHVPSATRHVGLDDHNRDITTAKHRTRPNTAVPLTSGGRPRN